ncbi:uncharacterized protein LOC144829219 [Lissotriton helveticus]
MGSEVHEKKVYKICTEPGTRLQEAEDEATLKQMMNTFANCPSISGNREIVSHIIAEMLGVIIKLSYMLMLFGIQKCIPVIETPFHFEEPDRGLLKYYLIVVISCWCVFVLANNFSIPGIKNNKRERTIYKI